MSKSENRKRLAALSFAEKLKLLQKLRDRSLSLARAGLRKDSTEQTPPRTLRDKG
jgi:hypothetical protein